MRTTKETVLTKDIAKACKHAPIKKKQDETGQREKLPTNLMIGQFKGYSERIRGVKPIFERGKDGRLIKHALKHLSQFQLEMLFVWHLSRNRNMEAKIGAALCREVIDAFIETSHREYGFYHELQNLADRYMPKTTITDPKKSADEMVERLAKLKATLAGKFSFGISNQEKADIAVEISHAERAAKL